VEKDILKGGKGMKKKNYIFKAVSVLMTLIIFALTLLPSNEAKAYSGRDKNGNLSLTATGNIKINLLVAAIDPTLSSIDGNNYWNGKKKIKASEYFGYSLDDSLDFWIDNFEEISHNTVSFNVVDKIVINEFPKYCSIDSLDNKSFQKIFKKNSYGYGDWMGGISDPAFKPYDTAWDLDYDYYIDKLNLVKRKNNNEFDMLFLIGIDPLSPCETCVVGSSPFDVNGRTFVRECDNFFIITPTFSRKDGSLENMGHLAEHMLSYNYSQIPYDPKHVIDGNNYSALNDWQKYSSCKLMSTTDTKIYGYGMVHYSPNSTSDYDWENNTKVKYYKNFKEGKDVQYFTADGCYLNDPFYAKYGSDATIAHHRWWFYNMPYADGRDKDGYYNNWWRYIFTPSYVDYICQDLNYNPNSGIVLGVGESTAVKFRVMEQPWYDFTTDTVASSAAVEIKDKSILSVSKGKIKGLKAGKTEITIKLDGKSVSYTVNVVASSQKDQVTDFVKRFYKEVLGRSQEEIDRDKDGINDWVNRLVSGEETGAQVAYGFANSQEFNNRKVSDEDYLKILYKSFFNRDPDASGYNDWLNKLKAGENRIVVLAGFTNSPEFKNLCAEYNINPGKLNPEDYVKGSNQNNNPNNNQNNNQNKPKLELKLETTHVNLEKLSKFVGDLYWSALGRPGDDDGIAYWEGCIINGIDDRGNEYNISTVISKGFFLSKEYKDMNKSEEEFTLDCYEAFFGRNPVGTDDEVNYWKWVDKLKTGEITRQEMIEVGFGYSQEFKNLLTNEYGFEIIE
jgi:hypothetical protein